MLSHSLPILSQVLNLPPEWEITKAEVHDSVLGVQAFLDHRPVSPCKCVGLPSWVKHGRGGHTYRALPVGIRPVVVHLTYPRYQCPKCGVSDSPTVPLGSVLPSFAEVLGRHALHHTVTATCRLYRVGIEVVRRCLGEVIAGEFEAREVPSPRYVGLDDTKIAGRRRAIWVDLIRATHIEVQEGYGIAEVTSYLASRRAEWEGTLQGIVIDPSPAYRSALLRTWPEVPVLLDRYHVAMLINQARTRWAEAYRAQHPKLKSVRALRHPGTEEAEARELQLLEQHPELVHGFRYVQMWQGLYERTDAAEARAYWSAWIRGMPDYLRPYLEGTVGNLDRHWRTEICAPVDHRLPDGRLVTNALTEALHKRVVLMRIQAGGMQFPLARSRLLLHPEPTRLDAETRNWEARAAACATHLQADSKSIWTKGRTSPKSR